MKPLTFTFRELLLIVGLVVSVTAAWYDLHSEVVALKVELRLLRGQVQWLLGEAVREGWTPPRQGEWVWPDRDQESP